MTAVQTQKIFFAMVTVNTVTVFEKADDALTISGNGGMRDFAYYNTTDRYNTCSRKVKRLII